MAGDSPDWTLSPPSEAGSLSGNGLFLTGSAAGATGTLVTTITHVVPAGKTFYAQGLGYGTENVTGLLDCYFELDDNGTPVFQLCTDGGQALVFQTAVPFAAGHTIAIKQRYNGTTTPATNYGSLWGWER